MKYKTMFLKNKLDSMYVQDILHIFTKIAVRNCSLENRVGFQKSKDNILRTNYISSQFLFFFTLVYTTKAIQLLRNITFFDFFSELYNDR